MKHYTGHKREIIIKIKALLLIVLGVLIPVGLLSVVAWYENIGAFSYRTPPDPSEFIDADDKYLADIAYYLDSRYPKYHLPLNQSSNTYFINDSIYNGGKISYTNVSRYTFGDNEALWTGTDYVGFVYKYLSAVQEGNKTMEAFAEEVLINMTAGLSMLMAVPNGGLGPQYTGILARGYCPPDKRDVWPEIFEDHPKHFNGTGIYKNWRWRGYTSNDEFGGYYLFLALATRYLRHIPFINRTVGLIVDQLCNYMLKNNFLGIHGTGSLTGVDQKPRMFVGGFWAPLLLKMGSIYYPEKYERIYRHYVAVEMYYLSAREGGAQEAVANYYALHFGTCVVLGFLLVENSDSPIWWKYFEGYLNSIWFDTRFHRNAYFNSVFLMICRENGIDQEWFTSRNRWENLNSIAADVEDQLWRFTQTHVPNVYKKIEKPLPEGYHLIYPNKEFIENSNLPEFVIRFLGINPNNVFTDKPLTCDYYKDDGWLWNNSPFIYKNSTWEDPLYEMRGASYFVPYWMMRYMGYLEY